MASQPSLRIRGPDIDPAAASRRELDERVLVARVRAGDVPAFTALVRAHYEPLCRFARAYLRDDALAEEVVQDVFAALWELRADWTVLTGVRRYLCGAVRNRALSARRRLRLESRWAERWSASVAHDPTGAGWLGGASASGSDAASAAEMAELATRVQQVVDSLPERCREAFLLSRDHQLSHAEIGAVMGTTPKTVEVQLGRAVRKLRVALASYVGRTK